MSDVHDDTTCPHLFEAATLSAQLVEAETQRDDYKRAWQRDLEKGREFLAERDDARRRLAEATKVLETIAYCEDDRDQCGTCWRRVHHCDRDTFKGKLYPNGCKGLIARRALASTPTAEPPPRGVARPGDGPEAYFALAKSAADSFAPRPTALDAATGKWEACEDCDGIGRKNHRVDVGELAGFVTSSECPTCKGTGTRKAEGVKNSESPPPAGPTGMKPGERCTWSVDNCDGHSYSKSEEALWVGGELQAEHGDRCPYVEPPAGPVCASCKPWCGKRCGSGYGDECWPLNGVSCFCTEACRDAGKSLHPEVPR